MLRCSSIAIAALCMPGQAVEQRKQRTTAAAYDRVADKHGFTVFMKGGGWCWYQDPRAIIHDGKVFVGSVSGTGNGAARVGIYDLEADKALGTVTVHAKFDRDDHNSPVFFARPDGRVLATYARHNRDRFHYSRFSDPSDPLKWSKEFKHERELPRQDKVTYMNLVEMRKEGKLYNFFRGINFNPTFVTSSDHGKTWNEPVHLFKDELGGRHRPYARYVGNGTDTVHVSITDAHPRNYGNSIYYFAFRDGKFFRADGTRIKDLETDGPLLPSESERVYKGSGVSLSGGKGRSAPKSAWTSSISLDAKGHPHIAYTLYVSNSDHRYRIASWDGEWTDREVAFAGRCLYERESSYTGLITLDPVDPSVVFVSTDVDPSTGKDRGGKHEIFRAEVERKDDVKSIRWRAVTKNSPVRNIRPVVLRDGRRRVVLWNRGDYRTYVNYDLDTVGLVELAK